MMKILLRLWWLQQRRSFSWKNVFVACYFVFLYAVILTITYMQSGDALSKMQGASDVGNMGLMLCVGMMLPDIIQKLLMKHDVTVPDDYLKSRPMPGKVWNRFLLLTNLGSFWNLVVPVMLTPIVFFLMPTGAGVATLALLLLTSLVNGLFITCLRKADEWMFRWPLVLGWWGYFMFVGAYIMLFAGLNVWIHTLGYVVIALGTLAGLMAYLFRLKRYDERRGNAGHVRSLGHGSLFSTEYISLLRAKRLRQMFITIVAVFLFQCYMFFMDGELQHEVASLVFLEFAVCGPSLVLGQWTFGVEGNYFHGLWSKPVSIERMLRNKFYFFAMLNAGMAMLFLPLVFLYSLSPLTLFATFAFAAGVLNLMMLPTCLFSSRLNLFSSAFFNYQGANFRINVYGIAFLVPIGLSAVCFALLSEWQADLVLLGASLLGFALHRVVIAKLAAAFMAKRYDRMEEFMK